MPRLFEREEPTIYKGEALKTLGLTKEDFAKMQEPVIKGRRERFEKAETERQWGIETKEKREAMGMLGLSEEEYPELLPKITESREFQAGQVSEAEQSRRTQVNQIKGEYKDFFLTQTELGQNKDWSVYINNAELMELEDLYGQYQEYQTQRQQQMITQVGEQLGLDVSMVEQMQRVYSPEELPVKMQLGGIIKTLLGTKHASATLVKQFSELLSGPTPEEEPDMGERLGEYEQYGKLVGEEGYYQPTELPFDITSELDSIIRSFGANVREGMEQGITSAEDLDANELLNAVMNDYYGNDETKREEAKQMINYTLRNMGMGTINWEMLE